MMDNFDKIDVPQSLRYHFYDLGRGQSMSSFRSSEAAFVEMKIVLFHYIDFLITEDLLSELYKEVTVWDSR